MILDSKGSRARVLLPALAFVAAGLASAPASAEASAPTDVSAELSGWPTTVADSIRADVSRLEGQRISSAPLLQKLREGRAKNVPPPQIAQVLTRMTDDLSWLDAKLAPCACARTAAARGSLLSLGADALLGALNRDELGAALALVCASADGGERLAGAFQLFSYVTSRLRAGKAVGWAFATTLLQRNEPKAAENQLVSTLQEVFKVRGNIDAALNLATSRLKAGVTLRATANELRDQFLRP